MYHCFKRFTRPCVFIILIHPKLPDIPGRRKKPIGLPVIPRGKTFKVWSKPKKQLQNLVHLPSGRNKDFLNKPKKYFINLSGLHFLHEVFHTGPNGPVPPYNSLPNFPGGNVRVNIIQKFFYFFFFHLFLLPRPLPGEILVFGLMPAMITITAHSASPLKLFF